MSRMLLALLGLTLLAIPAVGSDKIRLRVAGLAQSTPSTPAGVSEARVLRAFLERHPEVEILPAEGLKIEGMGDEIAPLMMIAGGISPDILYVNFRKIDSYVRQGFLYPLDEFIAEEEAKNPKWKKDRILPSVEPVIHRMGADEKEHYYALPTQYAVMGLYYNRPLFRQAGLPLRAPRDWNEMVEFSKKIIALDPRNKGLALNSGQQSSWNLMNFLWSTGAEAVEEKEKNQWRAWLGVLIIRMSARRLSP